MKPILFINALAIISVLIFLTASCQQPGTAIQTAEDDNLREHIRELASLARSAPDSLLMLLDAIWSENELTMSIRTKSEYYNVRGVAYQVSYRIEESQAMFSKVLQYLERLNDDDSVNKARIVNNMAGNYMLLGNLPEAIALYRQVQVLMGDYQNAEMLFILSINKGIAYSMMGNTDSALYYTQLASNIASEAGNRIGKAASLSILGKLFIFFGNYSQAEESIRDAIVIFEEFNDQISLWQAYSNLSTALVEQGRIDEALMYVQKSNAIAASIGVPAIAIHQYYSHRGMVYLEEGSYRRSLEMFHRALELREMIQDVRAVIIAKNDISLVHRHSGNIESALSYAHKALEMAQAKGIVHLQLDIYRNLLHIYTAIGDMNRLAAIIETEGALRDAVFAEQSTRALHEARVRYETAIKGMVIVQKAQDIMRQHTIIVSLAVVFIVLILLSGIVIFYQRHKVKQATRIVQQYEKRTELRKEKRRQNEKSDKTDAVEKLLHEVRNLFESEKIYRWQGLDLNAVAKMLNTNRTYISQAVNHENEKGFAEYINAYRIEEAVELIKQQTKGGKYAHYTIEAISEMVGFSNRTSFYTAFKQVVGVTPAEYKKVAALKKQQV